MRKTFSELRRTPAWHGITVGTLSEMDDNDALLAGIDELEKVRQGQVGEAVLPKFCLAYLTMAMGAEMGSAVPQSTLAILLHDMTRFVRSEGECGLPDCFGEVSREFLYGKSP